MSKLAKIYLPDGRYVYKVDVDMRMNVNRPWRAKTIEDGIYDSPKYGHRYLDFEKDDFVKVTLSDRCYKKSISGYLKRVDYFLSDEPQYILISNLLSGGYNYGININDIKSIERGKL